MRCGQPLSNWVCDAGDVATPPYYFGRRPEPRKVQVSPLQNFIVRCGNCQCERLKIKSEMDEASGELGVFLVCLAGSVRGRRWIRE
jgi:hypothetical protein